MTKRLHFHFSLSCVGKGNGNPLKCSCLENPRDGGAWWAAVYGVAQSRTRLKQLSGGSSMLLISDDIPCALDMYSTFFGCNVLKISTKSKSSTVSFRISVALLIFCLEDLSIDVSGVLKHPIIVFCQFPLGLIGLISLLSKGLSRAFSSTTVQKHQFFGPQPSLWSNFHIYTYYWKNHGFDYMDLYQQSGVSDFKYAV